MKICATQQHVPEAILTGRTRGEGSQDFLVIKMTDVVITMLSPTAPHDQAAIEMVSLRFGKVAVSYSARKPDGSLEPPTQFAYDLTANRPL
jgi:type VI secretion system secreted protein Hcp